MARIVVAGAGAVGASVAFHLALAGARDVVVCDRGEVAGGSTGRAMGVAAVLHGRSGAVRAGIDPLLRGAGTAVLPPVGYLFVAATTAGV
jgi:sarcosine oxidase, subunit beta